MTANQNDKTIKKSNIKLKKKDKLRYNEYYDIQDEFDKLYEKSNKGTKFTKLLELTTDKQNIKLAYRTIKLLGELKSLNQMEEKGL